MNRQELVAAMAAETGKTNKEADAMVKAFVNAVTKALQEKDKVQLVGFGTFETRERAARVGQNPQTGEKIDIAAATVPAFKAGKALKDAVK